MKIITHHVEKFNHEDLSHVEEIQSSNPVEIRDRLNTIWYFEDFGSYRSLIKLIQILLESRHPSLSNDYKNMKFGDQMKFEESPELHADVGTREGVPPRFQLVACG